jgi:hypothetical protein
MLAIGIPALLIAISVLAGMVAEARTERRLEEEALLLRSPSQGI